MESHLPRTATYVERKLRSAAHFDLLVEIYGDCYLILRVGAIGIPHARSRKESQGHDLGSVCGGHCDSEGHLRSVTVVVRYCPRVRGRPHGGGGRSSGDLVCRGGCGVPETGGQGRWRQHVGERSVSTRWSWEGEVDGRPCYVVLWLYVAQHGHGVAHGVRGVIREGVLAQGKNGGFKAGGGVQPRPLRQIQRVCPHGNAVAVEVGLRDHIPVGIGTQYSKSQ